MVAQFDKSEDAPDAKLNSEYSESLELSSSELESGIRRYRARFCKATPPSAKFKLTHYHYSRLIILRDSAALSSFRAEIAPDGAQANGFAQKVNKRVGVAVSEPEAGRGPHAGSPRGVVVATGRRFNLRIVA